MDSEQKEMDFSAWLYRDLAMAKTVKEMSQSVLNYISKIVPCQRASITLFDFELETFVTYSAVYEGASQFPPGTKLPLDSFGADLETLKKGKVYFLHNADKLAEKRPSLEVLRKEGLRSYVFVPIIYSKNLLGSINMSDAKPGFFNDTKLEGIGELANPLAIALHEAELRGELNRKNIELENKIVELKASEKKLKESENNFRALTENASDGILIASGEGVHVFANRRASEIAGYSKSELLKMGIKELAHPDEHTKVIDGYRRRLAGKMPKEPYDTVIVRKDGRALPVEVTGAKTTWQGHLADIVIVRDIEKRKNAEVEIKDSERILRTVIDLVPHAIYAYDRNGTYYLANQRSAELMNTPLEEMIGTKGNKFFPDQKSFENFLNDSRDLLETDQPRIAIEESWVDSEGKLRFFESSKIPFLWPATGEKVVLGVSVEITRRKKAEKELMKSKLWLQSIFNAIEEVVFVVSPDRKVMDGNAAIEKILGYSREELIGRSTEIIHADNEHYREFFKKITPKLKEKDPANLEFELKRKNGEVFPTEHTVSVIRDETGKAIASVSVIRDISERKKAEQALILSRDKLLTETEERKLLSGKIIDLFEEDRNKIAMELHDHIGQILTSLKMNLEMIDDRMLVRDAEAMSNVESAKDKVHHLLQSVKKIAHGLKSSTLDQLGLVPSLREFFAEIEKDTNLKVHFFSRNMPKRFDPDKELGLFRIVQESLNNIVKHASAKNVHVNLIKKGEKIALSVEDDGTGFDYEKSIKKNKNKMGILIMNERLKRLGGNLSIESGKGKGTLVLLEVPI